VHVLASSITPEVTVVTRLTYGVEQAFPATTTTRKPELFKSNVLSTQRHI
jgi:hypothetical protein